ncbi:MAG: Gfo/Idh/MocA family oxidoreductase [Actinomycetota bacterium]|nr:Gfo/Idh/MocA family oxidoreductase [Actinomycetota bacterium]
MPRIRAAIVGTGNIARFHVESLQALHDEVEIVAAVDIDGVRLAEFCAAHRIGHRYADVEQMLASQRPDLVHVCTPPGLHRAQVLLCLHAGASVVVEKPPTLTLQELDELAAAEGPAGPWVATVFQHQFGSGAQRLRSMVADGVLGRPLLAVCNTTWLRTQAYFDAPWRGRWDTEGGGPTMGHGIHQMDLLGAILGDWEEVSAVAGQQARRMETEDVSLAHVIFANGAVASVINSVVSPREESYLRFDFERATVELTHLYGYGDDDWRVTAAPGFEEPVATAWKAGSHGVVSSHEAQFRAVVQSLRGGSAPPVTTADARRTMQLVAGIYASAFQRRWIRPTDLGPDSPFYSRMDGDGAPW